MKLVYGDRVQVVQSNSDLHNNFLGLNGTILNYKYDDDLEDIKYEVGLIGVDEGWKNFHGYHGKLAWVFLGNELKKI